MNGPQPRSPRFTRRPEQAHRRLPARQLLAVIADSRITVIGRRAHLGNPGLQQSSRFPCDSHACSAIYGLRRPRHIMGVEGPHCQPTSFDLSIRHRQVKAVPGRKTDLKYGKWLADLLAPEFV